MSTVDKSIFFVENEAIHSMIIRYLRYQGWRFIAYTDGQLVFHLVSAHDVTYPLMSYRLSSPEVVETAIKDMVYIMGDSQTTVVCRACLNVVFSPEGGTLAHAD